MFPSFQDKLAVVTGGDRGIGRATAEKLIAAGTEVIIIGIDEEKGEKAAQDLGEKADFWKTDVSQKKEVIAAADNILQQYGRADILVNNAGIHMEGDVVTTDFSNWRKILAVNLDGVYLMSKYFIEKHMLPAEKGVVVNIGSEAGIDAFKNQVAYNVSKAAVIHLTKSIAVDFADKGIRANAVCPGTTFTPLVEEVLNEAEDSQAMQEFLESVRPLNRLGRPEEIAYAVLCMASEEMGYATGSVLSIDGGLTAE